MKIIYGYLHIVIFTKSIGDLTPLLSKRDGLLLERKQTSVHENNFPSIPTRCHNRVKVRLQSCWKFCFIRVRCRCMSENGTWSYASFVKVLECERYLAVGWKICIWIPGSYTGCSFLSAPDKTEQYESKENWPSPDLGMQLTTNLTRSFFPPPNLKYFVRNIFSYST